MQQALLLVGKPVARAVFRQPEDISHLVGIFCTRIAPGIWPLVRLKFSMRVYPFVCLYVCLLDSWYA